MKLNKTQKAMLAAIRNVSGIRFGSGHARRMEATSRLVKYGLITWRDRQGGGGWHLTRTGKAEAALTKAEEVGQ